MFVVGSVSAVRGTRSRQGGRHGRGGWRGDVGADAGSLRGVARQPEPATALRRAGGLLIRGLALRPGAGHPRLRDHGLRHGGRGADVRQAPALRRPAALLGDAGGPGQPEGVDDLGRPRAWGVHAGFVVRGVGEDALDRLPPGVLGDHVLEPVSTGYELGPAGHRGGRGEAGRR
jgi:hypothetical protein